MKKRSHHARKALPSRKRFEPDTLVVPLAPDEDAPEAPESSYSVEPPANEDSAGQLVVTIRYGGRTAHHIEGPVGLYPEGVGEIIALVYEVLAKHREALADLKGHE